MGGNTGHQRTKRCRRVNRENAVGAAWRVILSAPFSSNVRNERLQLFPPRWSHTRRRMGTKDATA